MAANVTMEPGGLLVIQIRGLVTDEDNLRTLFTATTEAQFRGKIRGLILLEGFEGWAEGHWSDAEVQSISTDVRQSVEKIAVVGPVKWRDRWLMFLEREDTPTEVRYFTEGEVGMARAWLAGSSV